MKAVEIVRICSAMEPLGKSREEIAAFIEGILSFDDQQVLSDEEFNNAMQTYFPDPEHRAIILKRLLLSLSESEEDEDEEDEENSEDSNCFFNALLEAIAIIAEKSSSTEEVISSIRRIIKSA